MARYAGWGGMPQELRSSHGTLAESITPEEMTSARRSVLNAHFTSPEICRRIWRTVEALGFSGGAVLEPSAGIGNFLGTMPESLVPHCSITAIEKDDLTGRMLRLIYPDASVRIGGFEESGDLKGTQDLVISNVPFGDYGVYDPEYHGTSLSIHNYFAVKALDCLKPGGIAAIITSRYTMDSVGGEHRMMLHDRGMLAGMVRLPSVAHTAQANTQVVTDVLFFVRGNDNQKRLGDIPEWTQTVAADIFDAQETAHEARVNAFVHENPSVVLGTPQAVRGMHHDGEYSVLMDPAEYREMIALDAPFDGVARPDDAPGTDSDEVDEFSSADANLVDVFRNGGSGAYYGFGSIIVDEGQPMVVCAVQRSSDGIALRVKHFPCENESDRARAIGFASLMEAYKEVVRAQIDGDPDEVRAIARAHLGSVYDSFVGDFGYIGRKENLRLFGMDPEFQKIASLEIHDDKTKTVTRAAAFYVDTISPTLAPPDHVDSVGDALIHSINHAGRVDLPFISRITGQPEHEVEDSLVLDGLAYRDPRTNDMELAALYLSGNVREKLAQARVASASNAAFQDNVEALEAIIPQDIPSDQIGSDIGQHWIPTDIVRDFVMRRVMNAGYVPIERILVDYAGDTGEWSVDWDKDIDRFKGRKTQYQVNSIPFKKMLNMAMNGQSPKVMKTVDKERVLDFDATAEALEVMSKLKADFNEHLWSPEWHDKAVRAYNDRHNNYVAPKFDGSGLHLHGMAADFEMRPHQKNAVLRGMMMGRALFAHDVGAGKTAVQIATAMQAKIFGSSARPMIVVPNSMLEQFSREAQQLYPTARILAISKDDLSKGRIKAFMGTAANNDWDLVITTHNSFRRIMLPRKYEIRYTNDELARCRAAMEGGADTSMQRRRLKEIEKRVAKLEARLEYLNAATKNDAIDGVTMDTMGIDMVIIDESHNFKNLEIPSTEKFAQGISGSARAWDLHNKIRYINEKRGNQSGVFFSSATPVSNNILELYNIQRYLQPDILRSEGLSTPEAWARLYLKEVDMWEPDPGGTGWRRNSRYTLRNAPELIRSLHQAMDVVSADDIGLVRPEPKRQNVVLEMTTEELALMQLLAERTVAIRSGAVKPWEDNMLAVVTSGRKLALDPRMLMFAPEEVEEIGAGEDSGKSGSGRDRREVHEDDDDDDDEGFAEMSDEAIASVVQNVAPIDEATIVLAQECDLKAGAIGMVAAEIYRRTSDVKGAQLIFCDYGTPGKDKAFVVYDEIRKELVRNGIPDHEIAYAQTPKNDKEKAKLFEAVRNGDVRILIGSTMRMGEGLNVQKRLAALHHLDPPWRPSDIEQREGRAIRFANMFKNVDLVTYTKQGSFDEFMWSTLKRKYDQFRQILRGDGTIREFDSEVNPTYAETLALTTGNALLKDRLELEQEVSYLSGLERKYRQRCDETKFFVGRIRRDIGGLKDDLDVNELLPDLGGQDLSNQWSVADHVVLAARPTRKDKSKDESEPESMGDEVRSSDWSALDPDENGGEQLSLGADEARGGDVGDDVPTSSSGRTREWVVRLMADLRKNSGIKAGAGSEVSVNGIWCGGVPINGVLHAEHAKLPGRRKSAEVVYSWEWSIATDQVDVTFDRLSAMESYLKDVTGPKAADRIHRQIKEKEDEIAAIAPDVFEHAERLAEARSRLKDVIRQIEADAARDSSVIEIDGDNKADDDNDDDEAQAVGY